MDLDRGTLARIDRKVVSGLGHDETYRMVRLPVSEATWSTWKRFCDAVGISMGRAIISLISCELHDVLAESAGDEHPVFAGQVEEQLTVRESQIAVRERGIEATEKRLAEWAKRLRIHEGELRTLERSIRSETSSLAYRSAETSVNVGRNQRCPCKSGLKYKHCHGIANAMAAHFSDSGARADRHGLPAIEP